MLVLAGCSSTTTSGGGGDGGTTSFAGVYNATFTGTYQNTSPNSESGPSTSAATITVADLSSSEVELSWQVAPNPPSGDAVFLLSGSSGVLADAGTNSPVTDAGGVAVGGSCFTGQVNGNTQTSCCTKCSISFNGNTFSQPNAGYYIGTTPEGIAYKGTYSGTWSGTLQ
jgi:hypothetical protein